jgi:hypothetical protein
MTDIVPEYRRNMDDAPRPVAAMAKTWAVGEQIPLHIHRRGQLLHAVTGIMRVETAEAAWIIPPARALWLPPQLPHRITMRSRLDMRTIYIAAPACETLPQQPVLVEISGLLRELILALLEEPVEYDEGGRGGIVARLILTELARLRERRLAVPMPRDPRAGRLPHRPRPRPLGRLVRRQPPHAGKAVPQRDRPRLCGMARPVARRRWPGAAFGRRLRCRDGGFGRLCEPERVLRHDPPHAWQPAATAGAGTGLNTSRCNL